MMQHTKTTLKNGTRVVMVPHRDTEAVTLLVLFEVGSRYEKESLSGASHYIEHMMFKGTKRRPNTMTISRDLDSVGADYNAFTSKDYTGYYIRLRADRLDLAVDMLGDMLFSSLYRTADLESERNVIFEEIRMYEDNPLMYVGDLLEQELYRGSSLGRLISGTVETMSGMSKSGLTEFRDRYYVPGRTVISVAGKFEEEKMLGMLEGSFGSRRKKPRGRDFSPYTVAGAGYRKPRVRLQHKETEQVQLAMAWPAYPYLHKDLAALNLLSIILGGNMSSRLFLNVREKRGLCYFIRSSSGPYQDVGSLSIQTGLAKDRLDEALRVIMGELKKLRDKDVSAAELRRAKDFVRGKMSLAFEDSSKLADWFAKQELLTRTIETPDDKLRKIEAVSRDDIRRVARDVIRPARTTFASIGPFADGERFSKYAERLT